MTKKKVNVSLKPGAEKTAEDWIREGRESSDEVSTDALPPKDVPAMKRLTIDVSAALHRQLKMKAAAEGVKMADLVREWIEERI